MNANEPTIIQAAAALGRIGGKAGRGQAKRRTADHYARITRLAAQARAANRQASIVSGQSSPIV